jgi:cellobiose-specific phosphotransferase system component IIB
MNKRILIISTTKITEPEYIANAFGALIAKKCIVTLWSKYEIPDELRKFDVTFLGPSIKFIKSQNESAAQAGYAVSKSAEITPLKLLLKVSRRIYREVRKVYRRSKILGFVKVFIRRGRLARGVFRDLDKVGAIFDGVLAADRHAIYAAWRVARKFNSPLALSNLQSIEAYFSETFRDL